MNNFKIKCKNWIAAEWFIGICDIGKFNGKPTYGMCVHKCELCETTNEELTLCMKEKIQVTNNDKPITKKTSNCSGCRRKKKKLNEL